MLVPMAKVRILGHRSALDAALAHLYALGTVQLVDVADQAPDLGLPPLGLDGPRLRELERLRLLRARVDGLLDLLPPAAAASPRGAPAATGAPAPPPPFDGAAVAEELERLAPRVEAHTLALDALAAEAETLPRQVEALKKLLPLAGDLPDLEGSEVAALLVERRQARVLPALREALEARVGRAVEVVSAPLDADTVGALLVFPKARAGEVYPLLGREQVSRVRLPARFEGLSFRRAVAEMERRLEALPVLQATEREALEDLLRPRARWVAIRAACDARIAQLEAARRFGGTSSTFVAVGWVPAAAVPALRRGLVERHPVDVEVVPPTPGEEAPVLLRNRPAVRPFQRLVELLSSPRDGGLDPSAWMAAFMPLFFGMMLGDVAYGLLLLAVAVAVGRRGRGSPLARDVAGVLRPCALWAIAWGVLYGELLGDLGHRLGWLHAVWFNREEALEPLLLLSVAVGGAHVVLGLLLGAWTAGRRRRWRELGKRLALLVALGGAAALLVGAAAELPAGLGPAAGAALVVGLVTLVVLEGALGVLLGPLELLGALGHVLSYLRIAAIGLASVYLARVANELLFAGPLWAGLVVAALLHALNLVLGAFSPTIQSLRLHYVEFFREFYEDGGIPFRPFGRAGAVDAAGPGDDAPWTPPSSPSAPASR